MNAVFMTRRASIDMGHWVSAILIGLVGLTAAEEIERDSQQRLLKPDANPAALDKPVPINWYAGKQYDDDIRNAKTVLQNIGERYPGAETYMEVGNALGWGMAEMLEGNDSRKP